MKKTWSCALMATLLVLGSLAHAAGNTTSASMEVSFRIVESCAIQSDTDAARATRVSCAHGSPYEVVQKNEAAPSTSATAPHADTATDTQERVLTVAF